MAPVFATTRTVASIERVMNVNVHASTIWPRVILDHQGALDTGSGCSVGDSGPSPGARLELPPNGDAAPAALPNMDDVDALALAAGAAMGAPLEAAGVLLARGPLCVDAS